MRVRAVHNGYFGGGFRAKGTDFDVPEGTKISWAVPVEDWSEEHAKAPARKRWDAVDIHEPTVAEKTLETMSKTLETLTGVGREKERHRHPG